MHYGREIEQVRQEARQVDQGETGQEAGQVHQGQGEEVIARRLLARDDSSNRSRLEQVGSLIQPVFFWADALYHAPVVDSSSV